MRVLACIGVLLLAVASCACAESLGDCAGVVRVFGDASSWTSMAFVVGDGSWVLAASDALVEKVGPETTQTMRYPVFISAYTGRAYPCELRAVDKNQSIALLKLPVSGLPAAPLAKLTEFSKAAYGTVGQLTGDDMVGNVWPTEVHGIASVKIGDTRRLGLEQWNAKKVFAADMGKSRWLFLSEMRPETSPPNGSMVARGSTVVGMYVKKLLITGGREEFVYGMCAMSPEIVKYLSSKGVDAASLYDPPRPTAERPGTAEALFALQTGIYSQLGANRPGAAAEAAEAVVKLLPDDAQARMVLGLTKIAANKLEDALKVFDEAAAIDPKLPTLRVNRAAALIALTRPQEAEAELVKAVEEFPNDVRVATAIADFYLVDEKNWDKALTYAQKAANMAPDSPAAQLLLGRVEKRKKDYKAAIAAIGEALKMAPEWPEAWYALGSTCEAAGELAGAEKAYRKIVEKQPKNPDAAITLASFLADQGKKDEAKELLARVRDMNPPKPILDAVQALEDAMEGTK